jgi:MinD superfamily P-loop ATPase
MPATIRRLRIAILSGKGGAGKTTVACGLTQALRAGGHSVTLVDADAEAPDAAVTLPVRWQQPTAVHLQVPVIDAQRCDGCGACAAGCQFNAMAMAGGKPLVFADLCHGCGACMLICTGHGAAIHEQPFPIGSVRRGTAAWGELIEARTAVGVARASQVISAALTEAGSHGCQIVDGPPGTSCSAVAALNGADLALVVVESTPFGRNDAALAVQLVRERGIPLHIVLNRCTPEDLDESKAWCTHLNAPIAATIHEDQDLDRAGAQGLDPWLHAPAFAAVCRTLARVLTTELAQPCLEPPDAY